MEDFKKRELEEIEEILKLVEKQKQFHLSQTNSNERDDLSQELDLLIFKKLQIFLKQPLPTVEEYVNENISEKSVFNFKADE